MERSGSGYIYRKLGQEQCVEIARMHAEGVRIADLAILYDVCRRTVYRCITRARLGTPVSVELGGYRAQFVVTPEGPVRLTPWFAA